MKNLYFCADEKDALLDRNLILRTLAVLSDIGEIDSETSNGEAFRKYVRRYLKEQRDILQPILDGYLSGRTNA